VQGKEARQRNEARGGIATIVFLAVGNSKATPSATVRRLSSALQKALRSADGSCLTLDWNMVKSMQPVPAQRMQVRALHLCACVACCATLGCLDGGKSKCRYSK
jgi:hypothetical protein